MLVHLQYGFHWRESCRLVISFTEASLGTPAQIIRVSLAAAARGDRHKKTPLSREWRWLKKGRRLI
jgi:hypothetical protein